MSGQSGLSSGEEVWLFDNLSEAIRRVREYLESGTSAEQIELTDIAVKKEIEARMVPWARIAEELVAKEQQ